MNARSITMLSKQDHLVVINVVQSAIDTVNLMNLSIPFAVSMVPVSNFLTVISNLDFPGLITASKKVGSNLS